MAIPVLKLRNKDTGKWDGVPVLIGEPAKLISQVVEYQIGGSGTVAPTGNWLPTPPDSPPGSYLWTRVTQTWNKGNPVQFAYPAYQGLDSSGAEHSGAGYANSTVFEYSLGDKFTAEQSADIRSGKFKLVRVGGYWMINGHKYWAAHADYRLNSGEVPVTQHHMLIVPEWSAFNSAMNTSHTTDGGYLNSYAKKYLPDALAEYETDFGADHILPYSVALTDGSSAQSWSWSNDEKVDLMNEPMVYGSSVFGGGYNAGADTTQLALFRVRRDLISIGTRYWLRDVDGGTNFAYVGEYGQANSSKAATPLAIRPAFLIY